MVILSVDFIRTYFRIEYRRYLIKSNTLLQWPNSAAFNGTEEEKIKCRRNGADKLYGRKYT